VKDIKLLTIRDLLPISKVEFVRDFTPLSLAIIGEKMDQATTVYINDVEAPEFVVMSRNRIMAQVPSSEVLAIINKVVVVAEKPSADRSSLLHFEMLGTFRSLQGIERLVQHFCKLLLQSPGSDKFIPTEGGGLLKIVGRNVSKNDSKSLQASVVGAVSRTRDQILTRQATNSRIPSDERLLSATTEAVGYDAATTTLRARIALSAVSGRQAVANLTV
jgi:hypothetical protein